MLFSSSVKLCITDCKLVVSDWEVWSVDYKVVVKSCTLTFEECKVD
jgi:hypothetical protein